jgi:protein ImuB
MPPIVVSYRDDNTQRILALNEHAEALGLKRGMGVADARARHPKIEVIEADREADARLLESLADWCDRYTPLVATDGGDGLFLDISGCAHLFGGEEAMLCDILRRLVGLDFDARGGIASTPGAAWAAARYGLAPVAPGEEADALGPLPLAALRLEPTVRAGLESVGLRTAGSVIAAPRAPLARRFGKVLIERIDQGLGAVDEAVSPRLPVAALSAERHFAEPLSRLEDVERLVPILAATLKTDLERRGEGARKLQLALFRVDGAVSRIGVGTSRPIREPELIARLFHERLGRLGGWIDAGFGFDLVRLGVLSLARYEDRQADLVADLPEDRESVAFFADKIRARLGEQAVLKPVMVESHIPEQAVQHMPFAAMERRISLPVADKQIGHPERPVRLFYRPEPVDVTAEVPEGPPAHFRWRRASYRVVRAEGPERIAAEWWREEKPGPTRDYYRIEDTDGRRYWLYREGLYGTSEQEPRWFLQGIFA